jgi:hypothetical protein
MPRLNELVMENQVKGSCRQIQHDAFYQISTIHVNIFETENYSACYNRMNNNFHNLSVGKVAAFSSDSIMYEGMELSFNQ